MNRNVKMVVEENGKTITIESNCDNLTMREWCQMFYASMIGITFYPETILEGMKDFVEEFEKTVE